jgi:hypothetical protein
MSKYGATISVVVDAASDEAAVAVIEEALKAFNKTIGIETSDLEEGPDEIIEADDDDED